MDSTTYEQSHFRSDDHAATNGRPRVGAALLRWLARIGERSAMARQAAAYRRLNALEDAQLARLDMKRSELLERCFGWRAYY